MLVVDDEPDIRELVRMNLEMDGHRVVTAVDGPDGLIALERERPDVVLLDVMMPGLDGWQVLGLIKAGEVLDRQDTPVVMLTALASDMDRVRGAIEGAVHYITKPFSIEELRGQVRAALDGEAEPEKRKRSQAAALQHLGELESGRSSTTAARPKLSRLENVRDRSPEPAAEVAVPLTSETLTDKQRELVESVATHGTVREAAQHLGVSRSNVYASLRRVARKLDVASVPELVKRARAGEIDTSSTVG